MCVARAVQCTLYKMVWFLILYWNEKGEKNQVLDGRARCDCKVQRVWRAFWSFGGYRVVSGRGRFGGCCYDKLGGRDRVLFMLPKDPNRRSFVNVVQMQCKDQKSIHVWKESKDFDPHACMFMFGGMVSGTWAQGGTIQAVHQVGPIRSDLNKTTGWLALSGLGCAPICMKS